MFAVITYNPLVALVLWKNLRLNLSVCCLRPQLHVSGVRSMTLRVQVALAVFVTRNWLIGRLFSVLDWTSRVLVLLCLSLTRWNAKLVEQVTFLWLFASLALCSYNLWIETAVRTWCSSLYRHIRLFGGMVLIITTVTGVGRPAVVHLKHSWCAFVLSVRLLLLVIVLNELFDHFVAINIVVVEVVLSGLIIWLSLGHINVWWVCVVVLLDFFSNPSTTHKSFFIWIFVRLRSHWCSIEVLTSIKRVSCCVCHLKLLWRCRTMAQRSFVYLVLVVSFPVVLQLCLLSSSLLHAKLRLLVATGACI